MLKSVLKLLLGVVLLIILQACNFPDKSKPGPNTMGTAMAQTQAAQPGIPNTGGEPFNQTPAPGVPQVSVSLATNCRKGPSIFYKQVGVLLVGQTAEVVGRNADNTYLIIRNPNRPGKLCWLWGRYATLHGNLNALPIFTPPPPPPPTATPMPAPNPTAAP